jgi:hypothetical protein
VIASDQKGGRHLFDPSFSSIRRRKGNAEIVVSPYDRRAAIALAKRANK